MFIVNIAGLAKPRVAPEFPEGPLLDIKKRAERIRQNQED
jgi:hypothetical protein